MLRVVKGWLVMCALSATAFAARLENGVLMVDGKPFYPLGSWNSDFTTPEDIARLGMNTSFRGGPGSPQAVEQFRPFMRRCAELGIQVVPYLSYGGAGVTPWAPEAVRAISRLAEEPNLLAWYVGDDITMKHLEGIQQTVTILREESPDVPTVADYIADQTPEAKTTFTRYVDIRCQYGYPIPNDSLVKYLRFFEDQRAFVGDPLWTWVQNFMWGGTGIKLGLGIQDGPGPIPDPEQVRLLAFTAINRGVRGLLFFPHHELHLQPELAAEVALVCREVRLFNDHLAAGATTFDLPASDADLNATAFRYGRSTLISAMLARPTYHRWVDEGIVQNVVIECPWPGQSSSGGVLPQAFLVAVPEVVECSVARGTKPGTVRVTVPSLELAGFVLLSTDREEIARLRAGVAEATASLARLALPGSVAQTRKVAGAAWQVGFGHLYEQQTMLLPAVRATERAADAFAERRPAEEVRAWREANRVCRAVLDSMMRFAEARRSQILPEQQRFLLSPYGLFNIRNLKNAPPDDDPWHFVREWMIAGPFPLEFREETPDAIPLGFVRVYPPETNADPNTQFSTVDGQAGWKRAGSDISGLLDFLDCFATTENVLCYARCRVIAPRDMEIAMSLGSNDGAKVWLNGEEVFSWHGGRAASAHQNEIPVRLKAGPNAVLVKVENLGANWQLFLSFHDPERQLQFGAE